MLASSTTTSLRDDPSPPRTCLRPGLNTPLEHRQATLLNSSHPEVALPMHVARFVTLDKVQFHYTAIKATSTRQSSCQLILCEGGLFVLSEQSTLVEPEVSMPTRFFSRQFSSGEISMSVLHVTHGRDVIEAADEVKLA